ncbi:MAG: hypothetical protein NZ890_11285, partial [Myxococcota bacterium]|nr:hypothetical protein [Myxococcota bacterium]
MCCRTAPQVPGVQASGQLGLQGQDCLPSGGGAKGPLRWRLLGPERPQPTKLGLVRLLLGAQLGSHHRGQLGSDEQAEGERPVSDLRQQVLLEKAGDSTQKHHPVWAVLHQPPPTGGTGPASVALPPRGHLLGRIDVHKPDQPQRLPLHLHGAAA